jgi:ABC-type amino acid transport substrate-binding protein
VTGTTTEPWLAGRLTEFKLASKVIPVEGYDAGIQRLLDRKADVFFGDRAILLDAAHRNPQSAKLTLLERLFTTEPVALAFARGDEDFRLLVDRTLSGLYQAGTINATYGKWFGPPSESVRTFLQWNTLPE